MASLGESSSSNTPENSNPRPQPPAASEMVSTSTQIQPQAERESDATLLPMTNVNTGATADADVDRPNTTSNSNAHSIADSLSQRNTAGGVISNTLSQVMRGPTAVPSVVVLEDRHDDAHDKRGLNLKEDLWLSTSDGRFSSPVVPIVVGTPPQQETFYVHKNVITRAQWFRTALCGKFSEAQSQAITLPEEDPAIFHFMIAYLYEGTYTPICPVADVLVSGLDDDNANKPSNEPQDSDSESILSASDSSARSRQRLERRRRRRDRRIEHFRQKHPNQHRPDCTCRQCQARGGPSCWYCTAPRAPPPPPIIHGMDRQFGRGPGIDHRQIRRGPGEARPQRQRRHAIPPPPPPGAFPMNQIQARAVLVAPPPIPMEPFDSTLTSTSGLVDPSDPTSLNDRIKTGEDMRTWLMTYQLNLRVYICADKYMLDGMKEVVSRHTIDMLESAGLDAAIFSVLESCRMLCDGLQESDSLLRMIFARVGFMLPELRRRYPSETGNFLKRNPEVNYLITCETVSRQEEEMGSRTVLPALERGWHPPQGGANFGDPYFRPPPPHPPVYHHARIRY